MPEYRHGCSGNIGHPLYKIWSAMQQRCCNPKIRNYHNYGGRGITLCELWRDFRNFRRWAMDNGYSQGLQIDRIDNDNGYSPDNCRFVTRKQNNRNKTTSRRFTIYGETKTLQDWGEDPRIAVCRQTFRSRILELGWSAEAALTTPKIRVTSGCFKKRVP